MEFFKPGIRINFLNAAKPLLMLSAALVLGSWALVGVKGLNYGIDFAGGSEALVKFDGEQDLSNVRSKVEALGLLDQPEVVTCGDASEGKYFVRSKTQSVFTDDEKARLKAAIIAQVGQEPIEYDDSSELGDKVSVRFGGAVAEDKLVAALVDAKFPAKKIQKTDSENPIYTLPIPGVKERLELELKTSFSGTAVEVVRFESVGSAVGAQMRNQGILSVLYALIGILLYVSFRFDLRYSPGAVLALVHDVSITIGVFSLLGLEFNLSIIAALLAIVGYSLNDTIVVYDRIRESLSLGLGETLTESINISISDCLSRTVLTSVTTFLAVLSIYVFGGGIIENFALAMLIGVVIGTYSSIYVASPAVLGMDTYLKNRAEDEMAAEKAKARARART